MRTKSRDVTTGWSDPTMTVLVDVVRYLFSCTVVEKGSWTPNNRQKLDGTDSNTYKSSQSERRNNLTVITEIKDFKKPEWLKQWTISKGWMHDRSHMLSIGMDNAKRINDGDEEIVTIENVEEFGERSRTRRENVFDNDSSEEKVKKSSTIDNMEDFSIIFSQISQNYRKNFPEIHTQNLGGPPIHKVYNKYPFEPQENKNFLSVFFNKLKRKNRAQSSKYTFKKCNDEETTLNLPVNETYTSNSELDPSKYCQVNKQNKSNLGNNLAMYNTMNSKTNLHQDTIYECSEDSLSLYNNPIYASSVEHCPKYFGFHTNRVQSKTAFLTDGEVNINNFLCKRYNCEALKRKVKTEKYIIRHIKIRIMLTLRLSKFKFHKRNLKSLGYNQLFRCSNRLRNSTKRVCNVKDKVIEAHQEQKTISNGSQSMKIQNMR